MKKTFVIMSLFLGLSAIPVTAYAESGFDPLDFSFTINDKTYTLPASVDELKEAGLNIDTPSHMDSEHYYSVDATDEGVEFDLRVELVDDVPYVVGYDLDVSDGSGIIASGISLDDTTASELSEQLNNMTEYGNISVGDSSFNIYTMDFGRVWNISADGKQITHVSFHDEISRDYGVTYSDRAGVADDDLPDPSSLAFNEYILDGKFYGPDSSIRDLLDNGWVLKEDDLETLKMTTLQPNQFTISGVNMFNGISMINVSPFNTSSQTLGMTECSIGVIEARTEWNTDIVLADGLTLGSSSADFTTVLGEPNDSGLVYAVLNGFYIGINGAEGSDVVSEITLRSH